MNTADLDSGYKKKCLALLLELKNDPVPVDKFDVLKLAGSASMYRVRIGKYRLTYEVHWAEKEVYILKLERRDEHTYS